MPRKTFATVLFLEDGEPIPSDHEGLLYQRKSDGTTRYVVLNPLEIVLPTMTTAERDALVSPSNGRVIFNSTTQMAQVRTSAGWENLN